MKIKLAFLVVILFWLVQFGNSQVKIGVETGAAFTGYNDARIPGEGGTKFSLNKDLKGSAFFFYRINAGYTFNNKHNLLLLFAPLQTTYEGRIDRDILFANTVFEANKDLKATYKFNSYRLTYRYDFVKKPAIEFGLGLTAKIRDAKIALASSTKNDEKTDLGFVPIINFRLLWHYNSQLGLLLQGDALAAPKGRAEDVLLAVTYDFSSQWGMHLGFRMLEGGGDVKSVYSFANINYAAIGLTYTFDNSK